MQSETQIPKNQVPVQMTLVDGSVTYGVVHVRQGQRILDMLTDSRAFFPLMSNSGTSLINKANVLKIDVMTMAQIVERKEFFPKLDFKYLQSHNW